MDTNNKTIILNSIGQLYDTAKNCKLSASYFEEQSQSLQLLAQYFKTTETQAFFIAIVFVLNYQDDAVDLNHLMNHFGCNPIKLLAFNDDFEVLYRKEILEKRKSPYYIGLEGANNQLTINKKITKAILKNLPMPEFKEKKIETIYDFLERINLLRWQRRDNIISSGRFFKEIKGLIQEHSHLPLVNKIKQFDFSDEDCYIFLYLCWQAATGIRFISTNTILEDIFQNLSSRIEYTQGLISGTNYLVKNGFIKIIDTEYLSDSMMNLGEISFQLLKENGIHSFLFHRKKEHIILPKDIMYKELIFDFQEMSQLQTIQELLQEQALKACQKRLAEKRLPQGITVLLHGAPGTGKTEIVKQIAKASNREIMKVEISQTKSKWFGESEKNIKRIFSDYKEYAKECERLPILLFNEADAIISKRRTEKNSNTGQTENAIQNILLEEFENFEGILIATTNLSENLDTAFDRRFLFKVSFQKPNPNIRAKIWQSKIPHLQAEEYIYLAEHYEFSGGQIENIIRKSEIQEIVNGSQVNFEQIQTFCNEESILNDKRERIGFCVG